MSIHKKNKTASTKKHKTTRQTKTDKKIGRDNTQDLSREFEAQKIDALGRFAGSIAHDFNNMMMIVRGYSDLLLRKIPNDDPSRSKIEAIHHVSHGAVQLTSKLLAFGRRQLLHPQAVNLQEHLQQAVAMIQELVGKKIKVATRLPENPVLVKVDRHQLDQAVVNMILNARDAMPDGGNLLLEITDIKLTSREASLEGITAGEYGMLAITDSGFGISPEIQQRIFEPYFTTKEHAPGKGLGLSTAYGIITQGGGHLTVASKPGKGTTFKIYLLKQDEVPEIKFTGKSTGNTASKGEFILVVENREGLLQVISELLTEQGYTVFQATNGPEALQLCESQSLKINLLFTDIVMPTMSGLELADRIQKMAPHMKVLFTSGHAQDAVFQEKINKHQVHFIAKPYDSTTLASKVREVLDEHA